MTPMSCRMFLLRILVSVSALAETGILNSSGDGMELSGVDGTFWELLA